MPGVISTVDRLTDDGSVTLFLFHGVIESQQHRVRNYTRKHLSAEEFRAILEALGRRGKAISMDDVAACCAAGRPFPRRSFAITFDDGFENNVSVARPILNRLGIPATVYVTSRFVDEGGMSWIDRIEWAFEKVATGKIDLPWSTKIAKFDAPPSKIAILDEIRREVKSNSQIDIDALVSEIFRQLDLEEVHTSDDPLDKKMTWEQVRDWIAPGFSIGGHSHTHAILSHLPAEKLAWELDTSSAFCASVLELSRCTILTQRALLTAIRPKSSPHLRSGASRAARPQLTVQIRLALIPFICVG